MILFVKKTTSILYDVSRLVLSQIVNRPAVLKLHNNNTEFVWWVVASYQLSGSLPTHVDFELGCDNNLPYFNDLHDLHDLHD